MSKIIRFIHIEAPLKQIFDQKALNDEKKKEYIYEQSNSSLEWIRSYEENCIVIV